jgi:hypothetical protein
MAFTLGSCAALTTLSSKRRTSPPYHVDRIEMNRTERARLDAGEKEARGSCFLARTRQEWEGERPGIILPEDTAAILTRPATACP